MMYRPFYLLQLFTKMPFQFNKFDYGYTLIAVTQLNMYSLYAVIVFMDSVTVGL